MPDQVRHDGVRLMKPIDAWPYIAMLIVVLFLIAWLGGYLT
jgi:hypothetical protein